MMSDDFKVDNGHPTFDKKYDTFNALKVQMDIYRHKYREGWIPECLT